jgi:hypothetical protein
MKIVSNPEDVCFEHAVEFWTGLLVYVREHSAPCVTNEPCSCEWCEELSASFLRTAAMADEEADTERSIRRAIAIGTAGPPPEEQESFSTRLAS